MPAILSRTSVEEPPRQPEAFRPIFFYTVSFIAARVIDYLAPDTWPKSVPIARYVCHINLYIYRFSIFTTSPFLFLFSLGPAPRDR